MPSESQSKSLKDILYDYFLNNEDIFIYERDESGRRTIGINDLVDLEELAEHITEELDAASRL